MTALLAPASIRGARPDPGHSSAGLTALLGLHLDSACAPAFHGSYRERDQTKIKLKSECPRFQGNPVPHCRPGKRTSFTRH